MLINKSTLFFNLNNRNKLKALKFINQFKNDYLIRFTVFSRNFCKSANDNNNKDMKFKVDDIIDKSSKKLNASSTDKKDDKLLFKSAPVLKVIPKAKRTKLDLTQATTERNFITPIRAMNEYLLKPSDLTDLRRFNRRSPYPDEPSITVYLIKDVEARALQVWNTFENLTKEKLKLKAKEDQYKESLLHAKKILKDYRRLNDPSIREKEMKLNESKRVVKLAIAINSTIFTLKGLAWWVTRSDSMFAELVHSGVDTANQIVLFYGINKSLQIPDQEHPYGFHNARFTTSLGAGVSIFFIGFGLNVYHGFSGLFNPMPLESTMLAYSVLAVSFLFESFTLYAAFKSLKDGAREKKKSIIDYIQGGYNPSSNVVFLEDLSAVAGVVLASLFMTMTIHTGNHVYDSIGSICIGGLLGAAATFIISTNAKALYGRSIPMAEIDAINKLLENDVMIRATHDVKATDLGNNIFRYKAEVDIDGAQLTKYYLDSVDLEALLKEMQDLKTIEDAEAFFLKHGENIVDLIGGEVDRIEKQLKKNYPELRHVDLEIL